jgi:crotonobetainyl-CoA:carnitine CoA-transferase CaiB-like acyl-CoA transferase
MLNFAEGMMNPFLEVPNRGKRSITLNLNSDEGRETLLKLCETADVFLTSYLPSVRQKLGVDIADVQARNPNIIYARGSGWGSQGPMINTGGYDLAAGWATSGLASRLTSPTGDPNAQPAAFFDLIGANNLAGAISSALFQRERTGVADDVDVSLMNVGMWAMGMDIAGAPFMPAITLDRKAPGNPITNSYPTKDGRWLYLVCLQADRFWPEVCTTIGREDLIEDPRFVDAGVRFENREVCVEVLDEVFGSKSLDEWVAAFHDFSGVWAPVITPLEVHDHQQVEPNGYLPEVTALDGTSTFKVVSPPQHFGGEHTTPAGPAPELGQHTEEVLLDYGLDWDAIGALREAGALG